VGVVGPTLLVGLPEVGVPPVDGTGEGFVDEGGVVAVGSGFSLVVTGAGGAGGDVARGGGQGGTNELADSSCNCLMAFSRLPVGSPA
jgi:hypothetical protein